MAGPPHSISQPCRRTSIIGPTCSLRPNSCLLPSWFTEILRLKTFEPILLVGMQKFENVDIRVRVKGGGYTAQIYAVRQAIAKALVAYYQKCALLS